MGLSAAQLAQHVAKALAQAEDHEVLAYAWPDTWNQGDTLRVGEQPVPVRYCRSPLQLREALIESGDRTRVLLVGCEESELGQDVLARLFRHRLLHVDRWQMVAEAFGARQIDPRLYAIRWLPDTLLDAAPQRRAQALAVLTYDTALETCLVKLLGLGEAELDLDILLAAIERGVPAWNALPEEQQALFRRYLADKLGTVALALLGAVGVGNGHAVVALGLVCEVLFPPAGGVPEELRDARVRLEPRLGGHRLSREDGLRWAEAAGRRVLALDLARDDAHRHAVFRMADDLLNALGAERFIGASSVLPQALDRRLEALAEAVRAFLKKDAALPGVVDAAEWVAAHRLIPPDHPGPETARMVVRLCRREAGLTTGRAPASEVEEYRCHGAWEDRARHALRTVRPESLARAVDRLLDRVAARRAESDRRFAEQLARRARDDAHPGGVLPVEHALKEIAAPLAEARPMALLVLDGMSRDVCLSIALELQRSGWTAWQREGVPATLLATVPSVTECSRASLLAGRLLRGAAAQEKPAFAAHDGLKRASRPDRPPVLLHKGEVQDGNQLSRAAAEWLADPQQRVVGIVLNAIDDALAKSEQLRIDWSIEAIPLLAAILARAKGAGRAVLITSDHGHVLERHSEHRNVGEAERWRTDGGDPEAREIRIAGPRVETLVGSPVIVPWSEALRYSIKKNGYHGGVTRQEMLVPVGIWTADSEPLPGFVPETLVAPGWWAIEGGAVPAVTEQPGVSGATEDLFAAPRETSWIDALLTSDTLRRQRERAGRLALDDQRLRTLLACLDEHGGRAGVEQLAAAIRQPQLRMRGVLSILQRMLNVDGYPVVTVESGSRTVVLDLRLLRAQFEP